MTARLLGVWAVLFKRDGETPVNVTIGTKRSMRELYSRLEPNWTDVYLVHVKRGPIDTQTVALEDSVQRLTPPAGDPETRDAQRFRALARGLDNADITGLVFGGNGAARNSAQLAELTDLLVKSQSARGLDA